MPSYEIEKEVIYTGVSRDPTRNIYIVKEGRNRKELTAEYIRSMGWLYDGREGILYKYFDVRFCSQCESKMMYDTHAEEFYCPIC